MKPPENSKPTETAPVIDGYEIIEKLGHGGTSSVWKARKVSLGRIVVIKVLDEHLANDPEDIRHFKHEALIAANLKHPGIVRVYDFGRFKEGVRYYFVMEYISGYTVGDWLRRKGKLEELDALIIAHSVAEALRYVWDQAKIVHCDIKPENIMVDGDGTIKVTDLGLAQVVSTIASPAHVTSEVCIMGTPNYMSPEQVRGEKNLDCRTDIYALGASLHHLLTGCLPFGAGDPNEIMDRQLREPFENPRKLNPNVSAGTARLVMKMLAKNANDRYRNWMEALVDIVSLEKALLNAKTSRPAKERTDLNRSSLTIPLHVLSDQPASPGAVMPETPSSDANDFRQCPYCAEPIRKRAIYCRYCGKEVQMNSAAPANGKQTSRLTLDPPTQNPTPDPSLAPEPVTQLKIRRHSSFWGWLRMLISLALLFFLCLYGYNKLVKGVDIMVPIRMRLMTGIGSTLRQTQEKVGQWFDRMLTKDEELQPLEPEYPPSESAPPPPAPVVVGRGVSIGAKANKSLSAAAEDQRIMGSDEYQRLLNLKKA